MSIPLILTAKNYVSASDAYYDSDIDTENGIFSYGSNYYKTFIASAEKGYKLPYVQYHSVAQNKTLANDPWEIQYSDDMNVRKVSLSQVYDAFFTNGDSGKQNRICFTIIATMKRSD